MTGKRLMLSPSLKRLEVKIHRIRGSSASTQSLETLQSTSSRSPPPCTYRTKCQFVVNMDLPNKEQGPEGCQDIRNHEENHP